MPDTLQSPLLGHRRIAVLTDGYSTPFLAKTAISLLRYRPDDIACVIDQEAAGKTAQQVLNAGGQTPVVSNINSVNELDALYIGIAPPGGKLPQEWQPLIEQAISRRMDIVSGLHDFLNENEHYRNLAAESGSRLIDVRANRHRSTARNVRFRHGCTRIHSVGHDCSVGKMVATLEVQKGLSQRGLDAKFLATGQTGIMISGEGIPIDCVVADFVNGAAEQLVEQNQQHDFLLVEGQGSISHPAFSAVTLGLLHGSAPDGLIFCYEAGRALVKGLDEVPIPPLEDQMEAYLKLANLRHPCQFIGVAVNTRTLNDEHARNELQAAADRFKLPVCDVYRTGPEPLIDACISLQKELSVTAQTSG